MIKPTKPASKIVTRIITKLKPAPENDKLYRPVDPDDPEVLSLAESIAEHGICEPLVITLDNYVLSGHRRLAAAKVAGLRSVPCRIEPIRRSDDIDEFTRLLAVHNKQRVKSFGEKVREKILEHDPHEAYQSLISFRENQSTVEHVQQIDLRATKRRCTISAAKAPMLDAIQTIIEKRRAFWPLSDRGIHYEMLNYQPLTHASKPRSSYKNSPQCYKMLVELLTRARLQGLIPWEAISDETRPVTTWSVHEDVSLFVEQEISGFCKRYWRNLMQSQPNHIEVVGEKNTVDSILKAVVMKYCIPLTTGRGFASLPPRKEMAERFRRSGKEKLVIIFATDFDADGEEIAHSFARSMRDDFGIENVVAIKASLTLEQVERYKPPLSLDPKKTSSNYKKFVERYGADQQAYELEAISPEDLQRELAKTIDEVIDREAFNAELEAEAQDAQQLEGLRSAVSETLSDLGDDWLD